MEKKRIKGQLFFLEMNAMIQMRTLSMGNLGKETILELGLGISQIPLLESPEIWRASRENPSAFMDKRSNFFDGYIGRKMMP